MEMLLNEDDLVVGARFENGTIQDYVNAEKTYGLVRIEESTVNWFLFNKDESLDDLQELYAKVLKQDHYVQDDNGEEIVLFNKKGNQSYDEFIKKIDEYLSVEIGSEVG